MLASGRPPYTLEEGRLRWPDTGRLSDDDVDVDVDVDKEEEEVTGKLEGNVAVELGVSSV